MSDEKQPTQFGQYVVQREIGRGGMGVVYLASDPRLERSVALKVLADAVADEPDRLARLSREAKSLATLNHPNVASIYGIEEQLQPAGHSRSVLVLEYVPGPTLSERLRAGPMPIDETLRIMAQVAAGLEAAHERGLIHRDLKPDNVKITPEGQAKVLDFGLAKAESPLGPAPAPGSSAGVTLAPGMPGASGSVHTRVGVVMGTPGYMSPEQCRGRILDKRTDIWSFGCVLYECLVGRQVFFGETLSDAIAAVLEREPDFDKLPSRTPPRVVELLHKCLEKDASRRLRDIGDARIELELALSKREYTQTVAMQAVRGRSRSGKWPAGIILAACGGFLAGTLAGLLGGRAATNYMSPAAGALPMRVNLMLDEPPIALPNVAVSPDGAVIAYPATVTIEGERKTVLAWKRLDGSGAGFAKDVLDVQSLAFAPDGSALAVTSGNGDSMQLLRVMVKDGMPTGAPIPIMRDAQRFAQLAWQNSGAVLVLSPTIGTLRRVNVTGGEPELVWTDTRQDGARVSHIEVIPGDQWAMVTRTVSKGADSRSEILRVSLTAGTAEVLIPEASQGRYLAPSFVMYAQGSDVMARGLDPKACTLVGEPVPLNLGGLSPRAIFSASREGTLVLPPAALADFSRGLRLIDTHGVVTAMHDKPLLIGSVVAPSPSGDRVALAMYEADPYLTTALRVFDVRRKTITSVAGGSSAAVTGVVWTPDGERLVWGQSELGKGSVIYTGQADGGGSARELIKSTDRLSPVAMTPDGGRVIVTTQDQDRRAKAPQLLDLKDGTLSPLGSASKDAREFAVSPDGSLLAYNAPAAGAGSRAELFVERFDLSAAGDQDRPRVQVSVDGVIGPARFSADGHTITFITDRKRIVETALVIESKLNVGELKTLGELDATMDTSGWTARITGQAIGAWSPTGLVVATTPRSDGRRELATVVTGVPELIRRAGK